MAIWQYKGQSTAAIKSVGKILKLSPKVNHQLAWKEEFVRITVTPSIETVTATKSH
jgi:hypothetical protein